MQPKFWVLIVAWIAYAIVTITPAIVRRNRTTDNETSGFASVMGIILVILTLISLN